jgi:restriction system protein
VLFFNGFEKLKGI